MKILTALILPLVLMACAKTSLQQPAANGEVFPKVKLTSLEACSADHACSVAGETCVSYAETGAVCYAQGKETEIAGCTHGELVILQSNPGQASCR